VSGFTTAAAAAAAYVNREQQAALTVQVRLAETTETNQLLYMERRHKTYC